MDEGDETTVTAADDDGHVWDDCAFDDEDDTDEPVVMDLRPDNETDILVFDDKFARAPVRGDLVEDIVFGVWMPAQIAFAKEYDSDAHFVAYYYDGPPVRVLKAAVEATPEDGRPEMHLLVFDVDDTDAHEQKQPASEAWRAQQGELVARLLEVHPGAFIYETRGGYRIVLRIEPRRCNSDWAAYYLACLDRLATAFGINADQTCKDYTRLFRLPRVLRDGIPEQRPWVGDPSNIGFFNFTPTPESIAARMPAVRVAARLNSATGSPIQNSAEPHPDGPLAPLAEAWRVEGTHEVNLAIGSVLALSGWTLERAAVLVRQLNTLVKGPWADVAVADVESSFARIASGQPATGWPKLRSQAPRVADALTLLLSQREVGKTASPRAAVEAALLAPKQTAAVRSRNVWRLVEQDLRQTRTLFVAQDGAAYSIDLTTPIVEPVFSVLGKAQPTPGFAAFVGERYGLNQSEKIFEFVMHEIRSTAMRLRRDVRRLAFFNRKTSTLYVSNGAAGIYRMDGGGFDPVRCLVPNGTDDVYFVSRRADEVKPLAAVGTQGALKRHLLDNLSLSVPDQERDAILRLLEAFLLLPFFRELMQTVPILVMVGPKGSGKSTTLRAYLKVLFGPDAEVQALPDKQDGFDALVVRDRVVVLDNVDRYTEWLQDRLAVLATGGEITRRSLYTDFNTASARPETVLAITSREPHFKRDDIVDRTIVVPLQTRESFEPEASLLSRISMARPEILGDVLDLADQVVRGLRDRLAGDPAAARLRLADFAAFACRVAAARGDDDVTRSRMLDVMDTRQREFFVEDDPIFMAIHAWISSDVGPPNAVRFTSSPATMHPFVPRRAYKAAQLFEALRITAEANRLPWTFRNVRSFGEAMVERKRWLKETFGLTIHPRSNANTYAFDPPVAIPSPLAAAGAA